MNETDINKLAEEIRKQVEDEAERLFPSKDRSQLIKARAYKRQVDFENGAEYLHSIYTAAKEDKGLPIVCPFCGEDNFDKIGLKNHLNRYCNEYLNTESL